MWPFTKKEITPVIIEEEIKLYRRSNVPLENLEDVLNITTWLSHNVVLMWGYREMPTFTYLHPLQYNNMGENLKKYFVQDTIAVRRKVS